MQGDIPSKSELTQHSPYQELTTRHITDDLEYQATNILQEKEITKEKAERQVNKVRKVLDMLNIPYVVKFDATDEEHGSFNTETGVITINPEKVLYSTVYHETGHMLLAMLDKNPLITTLINKQKG